MPNGQGSHVPAVYAAGGVIYALCFSEDSNPGLPTVVEISCGAQRKRQVQQFEQLKQRGGTVPLFVCLKTARGLSPCPAGRAVRVPLCGDAVRGVRANARDAKMVGGEARQATVTLSVPTAEHARFRSPHPELFKSRARGAGAVSRRGPRRRP